MIIKISRTQLKLNLGKNYIAIFCFDSQLNGFCLKDAKKKKKKKTLKIIFPFIHLSIYTYIHEHLQRACIHTDMNIVQNITSFEE